MANHSQQLGHTMKILFLLFGLSVPLTVQPISDQQLFTQANTLYNQGNVGQAYNLYKQVKQENQAVLYNQGMCAYSLKQYGHALAYWRKAERFWSLNGRINLVRNIIRAKNRGSLDEANTSIPVLTFAQEFVYSLIASIQKLHLQILVILLWTFLFVFLRRLYRMKRKLLIFMAFLLLCISASMLAFKVSMSRKRIIVTIIKDTAVFSGPGRNFALLGHLPEATETVIVKESGDLYKVHTTAVTGWIEKRNVQEII